MDWEISTGFGKRGYAEWRGQEMDSRELRGESEGKLSGEIECRQQLFWPWNGRNE